MNSNEDDEESDFEDEVDESEEDETESENESDENEPLRPQNSIKQRVSRLQKSTGEFKPSNLDTLTIQDDPVEKDYDEEKVKSANATTENQTYSLDTNKRTKDRSGDIENEETLSAWNSARVMFLPAQILSHNFLNYGLVATSPFLH